MNVRGGSTILHAPEIPKNYSNEFSIFCLLCLYSAPQSKIFALSLVLVCHPKLQLNLSKQNEISDSLKNRKIPTNKNVQKKFSNSHTLFLGAFLRRINGKNYPVIHLCYPGIHLDNLECHKKQVNFILFSKNAISTIFS